MITTDRLIELLNLEHAAISAKIHARTHGESVDQELSTILENMRREFAGLIHSHGNIETPKGLTALCKDLRTHMDTVFGFVSEHAQVLKRRINTSLMHARNHILEEEGWVKPKIVVGDQTTQWGYEVVNRARIAMGYERLEYFNGESLTEAQVRSFQMLASELDDSAFAEFICALYPAKFAYNNSTIQNLRKWLGEFETYRGNPLEDIPIPLLTLPELSNLRQLLFNRLRDKYFPLYLQGLDVVTAELEVSKERASDTEHIKFIGELIAYFTDVENVATVDNEGLLFGSSEGEVYRSRLKPKIGQTGEFPGKHQKVALLEIERQRQLLLADGMGGGKTGSAIAAFERLRAIGKAKRALIICPSEIINEWQKRLGSNGQGYFEEGKRPLVVAIRTGDPDRVQTWEHAKSADYVLMSIDMMRKQTAGKSHEDYAKEVGADFFVLDEAHNVKNPSGPDTERVFRISQCASIANGYTVLLTGTPVPNKIRDIAAQLRLLNAGQQRLDVQGTPQGINFRNLASLTRAIARNHTRLVRNLLLLRMLHRETEECLPVGTELSVEQSKESELSPIEQAYYDAIVDDPDYTATEKIQFLRRICLHPRAMPGAVGTGATKEREVRTTIDEYLEEYERDPSSHAGKIVIANSDYATGITRDFRNNKDPLTSDLQSYLAGRLREEYKKKGVAVFILDGKDTDTKHLHRDGEYLWDIDGAPLTETRRIIAAFRDHPGPAVLWTRTDVIGEGIDLSFASRGILVAPTYTLAERDQFIRRLYRRGQKHNVRFRILQIANSIERGMAEFALLKHRVIQDLLRGRPLTSSEEELLFEDSNNVKEGGFLDYEARSPRQKLMWIFNRIFGAGKEAVRDLFEMNGGRYAQELATLYYQDWETSFSGNTARLLTGLVQKYLPQARENAGVGSVQLADIACGGLTMQRMFKGEHDLTVWSSDLNPAMLEVGKKLTGDTVPSERIAELPMDEVPYKPESMHMAVLSLALHYTKHSRRGEDGLERVRTLQRLNTILAPQGIAFLTFPPHVFQAKGSFEKFCSVIERYFGFEIIRDDSNLAQSVDRHDEEPFAAYVLTLRKVRQPSANAIPVDDWRALGLSRGKTKESDTDDDMKPKVVHQNNVPAGSYHEEFVVGDQRIAYVGDDATHPAKQQHEKDKKEFQKLRSGIEELIQTFGSIQNIPPEELLSFSLEDIAASEYAVHVEYFRALLRKYGGRVENIPIAEINAKGSMILLPGSTKKKGAFLCIYRRKGGAVRGRYKKRYFYEAEFRSQESPSSADESITAVQPHSPMRRGKHDRGPRKGSLLQP